MSGKGSIARLAAAALLCAFISGLAGCGGKVTTGPEKPVSAPVVSSETSSDGNSEPSPPESAPAALEPSSLPEADEPSEPPEPPAIPEPGLLEPYRADAEAILALMDIEQKVWGVFLTSIPKGADTTAYINSHPAAGYLLFKWDFDGLSKEDVIARNALLSARPIPPLIAIDEEGGSIVRASGYKALREEPFPSPAALWERGAGTVYLDGVEKGQFLSELGMNLCLAPVADVSEDPADYIYSRTIGEDADETAVYVSAAVSGLQDGGVGSVMKHFPGYGGNLDTHYGLSVDDRSLSELEERDLQPFISGIGIGGGAVMLSHNIVTALDPESPASLSPAVVDYLTDELDFSGLIMTDDLTMDAIELFPGEDAPSVAALKAGVDLICHLTAEDGVKDVLDALEAGTLTEETVDEACLQVLAYKLWLGVIQPKTTE